MPTWSLSCYFFLKAEYDRVNHTFEGRIELDKHGLLPGQDVVHVPNVPEGDLPGAGLGFTLDKQTPGGAQAQQAARDEPPPPKPFDLSLIHI